jgi:hypothetical protein
MAAESNEPKPKLMLTGGDGNAFSILGRAKRAAKEAGWSDEKIRAFIQEATGGDYDHLVQVVMREFDVD